MSFDTYLYYNGSIRDFGIGQVINFRTEYSNIQDNYAMKYYKSFFK